MSCTTLQQNDCVDIYASGVFFNDTIFATMRPPAPFFALLSNWHPMLTLSIFPSNALDSARLSSFNTSPASGSSPDGVELFPNPDNLHDWTAVLTPSNDSLYAGVCQENIYIVR